MEVHGHANSVFVLGVGIIVNVHFGNILLITFTVEHSSRPLSSNVKHFSGHSSNYFF
jgi:hypothetical protein